MYIYIFIIITVLGLQWFLRSLTVKMQSLHTIVSVLSSCDFVIELNDPELFILNPEYLLKEKKDLIETVFLLLLFLTLCSRFMFYLLSKWATFYFVHFYKKGGLN